MVLAEIDRVTEAQVRRPRGARPGGCGAWGLSFSRRILFSARFLVAAMVLTAVPRACGDAARHGEKRHDEQTRLGY